MTYQPPIRAYVAVSSRGTPLIATLHADPDQSWRLLCAAIQDPDMLHERGYRIHRVECHVKEELT